MKKYSGFSSVEMGLSILLIIIIMSILVFYFNPVKAAAVKRNEERNSEVSKIVNGIVQYASDHSGTLPAGIPVSKECSSSENELCKSGAADCKGLVFLKGFSDDEKYVSSLPVDPKEKSANGTGYNIVQNESGRVTVCAPNSELGEKISFTK